MFLVHGWALHSGVWNGIVTKLARTFRVTRVDLPGHGLSRELRMPATLAGFAQQLGEIAPKNAVWLGWSLGGLICLRAALDCPGKIRAQVLVSSTPRFVTAEDWPCAMPPEQLQEFVVELGRDYHGTVQRFLALQVRGDEVARGALRWLRTTVFARGEPHPSGLAHGLRLLRDSDLRAELAYITMPTLVMAGDCDRLTPPQAGAALAAAIPGAKLVRLSRTAHAPFLSHPVEFIAALDTFMRKLPETDTSATKITGTIRDG